MPARALSQAEIDAIAARGRELLRAERAAKAPAVLNLDNALQLGQPIPLLWDGVEYRVKPISYREGLQLQRVALDVEAMRTGGAGPEAQAAFLDGTLALFYALLDPRPSTNPFLDATPLEVGELLGFFFMCLTRQGAQRSSRMGRRPPVTH